MHLNNNTLLMYRKHALCKLECPMKRSWKALQIHSLPIEDRCLCIVFYLTSSSYTVKSGREADERIPFTEPL